MTLDIAHPLTPVELLQAHKRIIDRNPTLRQPMILYRGQMMTVGEATCLAAASHQRTFASVKVPVHTTRASEIRLP